MDQPTPLPDPAQRFADRLLSVLQEHPRLLFDFYVNASAVVADLDEFGGVLVTSMEGEPDEETDFEKLRAARDEIEEHLAAKFQAERS